jgi:hypothetical protein
MRTRILAAVFAVCLTAMGQTLTIDKLVSFVESEARLIAQGKETDTNAAKFLANVRLSEKLDDRTIEEMQGSVKIPPKMLQALQALRERSHTLASAAPVVKAELPPPPSSLEQGAIIDEVRRYALQYSESLPNFICLEVTRRALAPAPGTKYGGPADSEPSWREQDTLTLRLSYFSQKEDYKLILVNNRYTTQDYKTIGGATSSGEFGSMLRQVFERATEAHFEWDHWATLRKRPTMAFSYRVHQSRSQWHVVYERNQDIVPAYSGLVYVDQETHQVTRITLKAEDIPPAFPVKRAETVMDYDYTDISGHMFLLPLRSETIMLADGVMSRNRSDFVSYNRYSADTVIKFDSINETPEAVPDDKTKESQPAKKKQ